METIQPALKNGRNIWDPINMPASEFQNRVGVVRESMKKKGLDILLVYGRNFNEYGNPCYFSNYVIRLAQGTMMAIPRDGDAVLFFEGAARGVPSAKILTWVEDVRSAPNAAEKCVEYLIEKGFIPGTIGVAGVERLMPYQQRKFLRDALGECTVINADEIVADMRMVKSVAERNQIRRASRIVKRCFDLISHRTFANMNERSVEASIIKEARLEGAEDVRLLIGNQQESPWALRPTENKTISPDTAIVFYLTVAYERYWSEAIRTFTARQDSFAVNKADQVEKLYQQLTSLLIPGKEVSQYYQEYQQTIEQSGLDCFLTYGTGQGIGLSPAEKPLIEKDSAISLADGMCLTLRLGVKDKTQGDIMLGETWLLTDQGIESLQS